MRKELKKVLLPWLDWNENKSIDWWEYLIPISIILSIEIIAELIAYLIINL